MADILLSGAGTPTTTSTTPGFVGQQYLDTGTNVRYTAVGTTSPSDFVQEFTSAERTKLTGIENGAEVNDVDSVAGRTGAVVLTSTDVGLANVTNDAQLKAASNLSDVANATTARANLGANSATNLTTGTLPAARFNDTSHGSRGGGSLHAAATTSVAGFMASADKTKLDAIEAGATTDQTAAEIRALGFFDTTNDGAASGLDADKLDGKHAASFAELGATQTFTKAQRASITALVDGATITPDFAASNHFSVTLGGNRTLANPSNVVAGQSGSIRIAQDGTGSRTLAYGTNWKTAGGTAPTLSTAASTIDRLDYWVATTSEIHYAVALDIS
ncbi:MAG: hypothetical protein L0H83_16100 [Salinisphaera sp.]|nr:hypothetical protein [Salinisphaera sp.]